MVGDLAVVSDRIRVYRIDPAGAAAGSHVLTDLTDPLAGTVFSATESAVDDQRTAYGLAAGVDRRTGTRLVVTTQRHEARVAGHPARTPARARSWRARSSTRPAACSTPRRRTSGSGGCR
ncbi:hypothetical protein [Amycolatopsis sp. H20-H5]|uniref:hypothetical protein n=1 Tax=Amycolatopsis sp. H20-H5 TaxID=3046309 RepID=UPI002DBD013A|nr:hypothetical protein [Amycolatopsis sp. H20-H5]MEC3980053.1 hypothetical protein [Amycolatopsis sp. H20-H5]